MDDMFEVIMDNKNKILTKEQEQLFHRTMVQLILLRTSTRWDITTAVELLNTQVKDYKEDD